MTRTEKEVARELFGKCYFCAGSIRAADLNELVEVSGRPNRLAHRDCLAAEADDDAA